MFYMESSQRRYVPCFTRPGLRHIVLLACVQKTPEQPAPSFVRKSSMASFNGVNISLAHAASLHCSTAMRYNRGSSDEVSLPVRENLLPGPSQPTSCARRKPTASTVLACAAGCALAHLHRPHGLRLYAPLPGDRRRQDRVSDASRRSCHPPQAKWHFRSRPMAAAAATYFYWTESWQKKN